MSCWCIWRQISTVANLMEWIGFCLSSMWQAKNIIMILDEVSSGQHDGQQSCAVSAAFHTGCTAASPIITDIRPVGINMPSGPALHRYKNVSAILGFSGACMRLVYRISDQETKILIKRLQLTEAMKELYAECGVLSPGTCSHETLSVRGLNIYHQYLSTCPIESCATQALLLYGKHFAKVFLPNHSRYNQNWM